MWARCMGLRGKATAMAVPSSSRSRVLGRQHQREEGVVLGLGRDTARRSRCASMLPGPRADRLEVRRHHRSPSIFIAGHSLRPGRHWAVRSLSHPLGILRPR